MSKLNEWSAENLERAAKHMRELDKSMNAKAAIELAKREQDVEMARSATEAKRQEALKAQYAGEVERIRWEEQRRTLELKKENEKVSARCSGRAAHLASTTRLPPSPPMPARLPPPSSSSSSPLRCSK